MMAAELSELEKAIETLVKNYETYSSKRFFRRKHGISKDSFQKMLSQELCHMLTNTENRQAVDQMWDGCDKNQDGQISFGEYWNLMGRISQTILFTMQEPEDSTEK